MLPDLLTFWFFPDIFLVFRGFSSHCFRQEKFSLVTSMAWVPSAAWGFTPYWTWWALAGWPRAVGRVCWVTACSPWSSCPAVPSSFHCSKCLCWLIDPPFSITAKARHTCPTAHLFLVILGVHLGNSMTTKSYRQIQAKRSVLTKVLFLLII